jgi:hypothetical protein
MFNVGENVFLRKITMILTGRVVAVHDTYIELDNAAWIADTGRYANAVKLGQFSEVEPYPDGLIVKVPLADLVDAFVAPWPLPRTQI